MTRVVRRLTIGTVLLATVAGPLGPGASASSTGTVPTVITMQRPQINVSAGTVTLRGVLYRKGYPSARIRTGIVYLQRSSGGTRVWTNVGVTRTSSTGSYAFTVATPAPFMYRARFAGSPTFAPSVSGFVGVPGRFRIFLASFTQSDIDYETPPWPTPGYTLSSWLTATGRISPAVRITNAWIQRYNDATRKWEQPADWKFSIQGDRFTVRSTARPGPGKFRLEFSPASWPWYGTASGTIPRTVYRAIDLNDQRTQAGTNYGGTGWYSYSSSSYPLRPQILKLPPGGSAWMIADVSRCVRLNGITREDRSPRTRFTVQTGTATLQTIELTPANAHTAWSSLSLSGVNAIRITMTNLDPATPSSGSFTADLTCAR